MQGFKISKLVVHDLCPSLFKLEQTCQDVATRKEYVQLVDSVRDSGGEVKIFSSMHVSGEQLAQLTGVAAILRFPMPELEDSEDERTDSDLD
ncbi:hypothetical protein RP20_CCG015627 [Aedes albopictus]|nr:hypothetical protein RP20_CCG015627 [Aedes albopictus]